MTIGAACAWRLDIAVADENGKASAEQQRDAEADAIAELCARLIENHPIIDRRSGAERPPAGRHRLAGANRRGAVALWGSPERRGIPVATQISRGCSAARRSRI